MAGDGAVPLARAMPAQRRPVPRHRSFANERERLLYEVLMLSNTAALLDEDVGTYEGWRELTRYMAVVESFLAHTHSLLRFLYPPRRVLDTQQAQAGARSSRSTTAARPGARGRGRAWARCARRSARTCGT